MELANLIDMAQQNERLMDGTLKPVAAIIASSDVVYAVYNDSGNPAGVGSLLVKGAPYLTEIATGSSSVETSFTAFWTADQDMAMAAHLLLGDGRLENSRPN